MVDQLNGLLELLCHRYGFVARGQWAANLDLAAQSMGRTRGVSTEEIIGQALTDQEMQRELVGYLAVDESYFFRHGRQFDILAEHLEKRLSGSPEGEPIVIWSAGCADGQEPYSIAMTLLERLGGGAALSRISIMATDMNRQAIARARQGIYTDWSFRGMNKQRWNRYFKPCADNNFALCEEIRNMVTFHCMSIQEHAAFLAPSSLGCIFFRNVGIYLQPQAQAHIYERFYSSLHKSGLLFLAPSDAMPARNLFAWDRESLTSVYTPTNDKKTPPPAVIQGNLEGDMVKIRPDGDGAPAVQTGNVFKYKDENQQAELALTLADSGKVDQALLEAENIVAGQPNHKLGYLIRGQIHLAVEALEDAINDLRMAVFMDPDDTVVRFWYAYSLQKSGAHRRSLMQINNLMSQLTDMQHQTLLKDGRTTAGELLTATRQLKELLI